MKRTGESVMSLIDRYANVVLRSFLVLTGVSAATFSMFISWFESLPLSLEHLQWEKHLEGISIAIFAGGVVGTCLSGIVGYSLIFHSKLKLFLYLMLFFLGFAYTWFSLSFPSLFSTSAALPASLTSLLIAAFMGKFC